MNILQVLVKLRDDLKAWTLNLFDSYGSQVQIIADEKMSKINPTATGSLSLNRKPNVAIGSYSTTEGLNNAASGTYAHAEGHETSAPGTYAHAEGYNTIASGSYQHVEGKFNIVDYNALHIVGNGSSSSSRSNAYVLDQSGNAKFAGIVSDSRGELLDKASFNTELEAAEKELAPIVMQNFVSNEGSLIISFDGNVNKPFMIMDSSDDGIQIGYFKVSNNYKEIGPAATIAAGGLVFLNSTMELPTDISYYMCWKQDIKGGYQLIAAKSSDIGIPYVIGIYSEDNDFGFTPGMYTVAVVDTYASYMDGFIAPYIYIKEVYDIGASDSYDIDWHNISFTDKDNYLQATHNQLIWDGVSHFPDYTDGLSGLLGYNVSMRGAEFIKLFKLSSGMLLETKDGNIAPLVFYRDSSGAISFKSDIMSITPCLSVFYEHKLYSPDSIMVPLTPGIYFDNNIKSITFLGINNVDEIFNHKLPHEAYNCPAYEAYEKVEKTFIYDESKYTSDDIYGEVDVSYVKIGSLEDFNHGNIKITNFEGEYWTTQLQLNNPKQQFASLWDDKAKQIILFATGDDGTEVPVVSLVIVYDTIPNAVWTRGFEFGKDRGDMPPGIYAFCAGLGLIIQQMTYATDELVIHRLDEKFLPEGMMLVPIPEDNEGAILQVVNGKPTWVSLPAAEESEF